MVGSNHTLGGSNGLRSAAPVPERLPAETRICGWAARLTIATARGGER